MAGTKEWTDEDFDDFIARVEKAINPRSSAVCLMVFASDDAQFRDPEVPYLRCRSTHLDALIAGTAAQ